MNTVKVLLNSIEAVKSFVNIVSQFGCEMDLISGRYTIDAKSIMGIFSLDLSKPIDFGVHGEQEEVDAVLEKIHDYIV